MNPLEPLPSHQPVPPTPEPARPPAADRSSSPPAASGRQPAGAPPQPLQASFRFDDLARQAVVTLLRPETGEVVRQIPPEKILSLIVYLRGVTAASFDRRA